jgi:hypothetical protein
MIWFLEDYRDDVVLVVRAFSTSSCLILRTDALARALCDPSHDAKVEPPLRAAAPRLQVWSTLASPRGVGVRGREVSAACAAETFPVAGEADPGIKLESSHGD